MNLYNKIMLYFWLALSIASLLVVTVMGFLEGFDRWYFYYFFSGLSFMMFIVRKWMMRRMAKHLIFLEDQKKSNN